VRPLSEVHVYYTLAGRRQSSGGGVRTDGFVLSTDQGTTGTTVLVFDRDCRVRGRGYPEFLGWDDERAPREVGEYRRYVGRFRTRRVSGETARRDF